MLSRICNSATEVYEASLEMGLTGQIFINAYIRHSLSVQGGPAETRTLRSEGITLARDVSPYYEQLFRMCAGFSEQIDFGHSRFPRAFATGWEIAHPEHYRLDPRISLVLSLKAIDGGKWMAEQKKAGKTVGQMIVAVHENLGLLGDQPYNQRMDEINGYFTDYTGLPVKVRFGHEPESSFWLLKNDLMLPEMVGLKECQGYIVIATTDGIQGVIKFTPSPTIKC